MNGLLSQKGRSEDIGMIENIAAEVAAVCNERFSEKWGFTVHVLHHAAVDCSQEGTSLFNAGGAFAASPGPFKRAAAFVVLGRLTRLFQMQGSRVAMMDDRTKQAWRARLAALLIPGALCTLKTTINGKEHLLTGWKGWPSNHYKLEFIAWLKWLDFCKKHADKIGAPEWNAFRAERLARMTMACSLILEGMYYIGESTPNPGSLLGQDQGCVSQLNEEQRLDLDYDVLLSPHGQDAKANGVTTNGAMTPEVRLNSGETTATGRPMPFTPPKN